MNAAKIIESGGKSVEHKGLPGLFDCLMEHEVKQTTAQFNWIGPKITPAVWNEILAFFRWTQQTEQSEAQVRLFVHPQNGWLAWAFPQQGGTSMTTKEIENEEAARQRSEQIPAGYLAFGTVHHHCSASAFQSSTDARDEKSVDGLHITVGDIDKVRHTLDCRLYIKGNKFEPNMAAFWDVGSGEEEKIDWLSNLGYATETIRDKIARTAMCQAPPINCGFNVIWQANYIVSRPIVTVSPQWQPDKLSKRERKRQQRESKGLVETAWDGDMTYYGHKQPDAVKVDIFEDLIKYQGLFGFELADIYEAVAELGDGQHSSIYQAIADFCEINRVNFEELFLEMMRREAEETAQEINGQQAEQAGQQGS